MSQSSSTPPPWIFDDTIAARLVGRTLLVGITEHDHLGALLGHRQIFGTVTLADRRRGICIKNAKDGSDFWFPPDTRAIRDAKPGEYTHRASGEVIKDPDFFAAIVLTKAPPKDK